MIQTRRPRQLRPPADRFWSKVDASGDCWEWTGSRSDKGYGNFCVKTTQPQKQVKAHRWAWEHLVGPISEGLELDHLCRNRACVNPDHLEPVTHRTNVERGAIGRYERAEECKRGHFLIGDNVYVPPAHPTRRYCRKCQRMRNRGYERRHAEKTGKWR